ncbi:MAG: DUF3793 family protein [Lachnospirales bacterium]
MVECNGKISYNCSFKFDTKSVFVRQCFSVLAGLKEANLYICRDCEYLEVVKDLKNTCIHSYLLYSEGDKRVFFLYNKCKMLKLLEQKEVQIFLEKENYTSIELNYVLDFFKERYIHSLKNKRDFPHEMGILLGYPIEDIKGFIDNEGKNSLLTGYWKVYADFEKKRDLFNLFDKAKNNIISDLSCGVPIKDIIKNYNEMPCMTVAM